MKLELNANNLPKDADWLGINAAFTCPICKKVFIVSSFIHDGKEVCPRCNESTAFCTGPANNDGRAYLNYEVSNSFWKTKLGIPYWQLFFAVAGINLITRMFIKGQVVSVVLDMMWVVVFSVGIWKLGKFLLNKHKESRK